MSEGYGECVLQEVDEGGRRVLRVLQADRLVKIAPPVVEAIKAGRSHPDVTLDGDLLTIKATNRTVAYRLTTGAFVWLGERVDDPEDIARRKSELRDAIEAQEAAGYTGGPYVPNRRDRRRAQRMRRGRGRHGVR